MAPRHVVPSELLSGSATGRLSVQQKATPVMAARAPAVSPHAILPVQSGVLPNPTGLPHGTPAHHLTSMGVTKA